MKARHFLLGATLLSAGLLFNAPLFAAVESDVVGYTTIQMDAGKWYQIGSPFVGLKEGVAGMELRELLGEDFEHGDTVSVFSPESGRYDIYTWKTNAPDGEGWYLGAFPMQASVKVPSGRAVFVNKASGKNGVVTFSGKVSADEVVEFGTIEGNAWDQIVSVYPKAMKLNDLKWEGLEQNDTVSVYSPDEGKYLIYTWKVNAPDGEGWYLGAYPFRTSDEVAIGQAMFVNKQSANIGSVSLSTSHE